MSSKVQLLEVAKIGKVVGLGGELKLHIHSDFPEQFKKGATFKTDKGLELEVLSYNPKRGLVLFKDYESREKSIVLVNSYLMTSVEDTRKNCNIEEDEFFWFDILGLNVKEDGMTLGLVSDIERIGNVDYLVLKSDESLVKDGFSKTFYIPFIERYILDVDRTSRVVFVKDGLTLLESS